MKRRSFVDGTPTTRRTFVADRGNGLLDLASARA
jgi:hypothetical protein